MVLRVAVVGSGPSGLYAAEALTDQTEIPCQVDVIDRLPVPFGLVRYGVAPDHFSIRSVRDKLDELFDRPAISFIGNCTVGSDCSVEDLRDYYDAVLFTYGASRDRTLGIAGEDLHGSVAATDFVAWYCGHPDQSPDAYGELLKQTTSAVVIGVGNVAVDVTRVLAKNREELAQTDMPEHVLAALAESAITDIHVLGRRGPAQGAFTTKELRELGELADADVLIDPELLDLDPVSAELAAANKVVARNIAVMREWAERSPAGRPRRIHMRFLTKPVEICGVDHVSSIVVERTAIDSDGGAIGTGVTEVIPAQMVVRSVGYRGVALPGLPFDERANVIPHEAGRVLGPDGPVVGCYVAGWIKRGPTGIIGTNKKDASATVAALLEDARAGVLRPKEAGTDFSPSQAPVSVAGWRAIDTVERERGAALGKDRVTIHDRDELLQIAQGR
jgi:ferredoxin--NADP+ reductase